MAWRCSGRTNAELIANLRRASIIETDAVAEAMRKVDRRNYLPGRPGPEVSYQDAPQSIDYGATISAPHMHAYALESLAPFLARPGASALDVGSGSGYLLGVLHHLAPPPSATVTTATGTDVPHADGGKGKIIGIEHIDELTQASKVNLKDDGLGDALESGRIEVHTGDGRLGWPDGAPYSVIHVGAAAPSIPQALIDQLARPGRLFIPVGQHSQDIWEIDRSEDGTITKRKVMGVRYVPLTDAAAQWPR
ncbi:hypothetical protein CF327_g6174 [Tilletia walkeri]|uniref:protein-L-isoaspartate(D-aspartate) O-methyltransferase n=1 Tax=Tilletia walkeri TaxID=117179 RepID=A0A8X7T363_9BASI|nr:hypothetical protein CF327_g6174 [Tilletia walkeri]KAE8267192.1 hypothetical protein A4X09_0g5153 [Tilletia walkeri]